MSIGELIETGMLIEYMTSKYWEDEEEICQQIYCQMVYESTTPWS